MTGQHTFRTVTTNDLASVWPRATLVDVRSREEHAIANVPGSLNIPLDDLPSRLTDLPNATIYVLCGSGKRSSQAARTVLGGHPVTYQQVPESPPSQDIGRTPGRLHTLLKKLSSRKTAYAPTHLQDTPRGI
jgi:hypothetical protein